MFGSGGADQWSDAKGSVPMILEQIEKLLSLARGNLAFSKFSPIFPPVSPTNLKLLVRIAQEKGYYLRKFYYAPLKIVGSGSISKTGCFQLRSGKN